MFHKSMVLLVLVSLGLAATEKITIGNRKLGDSLLFSLTKSTLPTDLDTKHELLIDEKGIKVTYVEFNVYPSAQETTIRRPNDSSFQVSFVSSNVKQLIGDYRIFGYKN